MIKTGKRDSLRGTISIVLIFGILLMLFSGNLLAQTNQAACNKGLSAAVSDISGGTWFTYGCLLGPFVYLIGFQPNNPSATNLIGKSPEYVAAYTDCYRNRTQKVKTRNATTGCFIGTIVWVAVGVIVFTADNSSQAQ